MWCGVTWPPCAVLPVDPASYPFLLRYCLAYRYIYASLERRAWFDLCALSTRLHHGPPYRPLCYPVVSYPVLSCSCLPCPFLSPTPWPAVPSPMRYLVLHYPVLLSGFVLSCPIWSWPTVPCPILSYPVFSFPLGTVRLYPIPHPGPPYPPLRYPVFSSFILPCSIFAFPLLPCPALPCSLLSCPVLCHTLICSIVLSCLSYLVPSCAAIPRKAAAASAEVAVNEAQDCVNSALGAEQDDGDGTPTRPPPRSIVSSDERYELESAAKKARKAGSSVSQVRQKWGGGWWCGVGAQG